MWSMVRGPFIDFPHPSVCRPHILWSRSLMHSHVFGLMRVLRHFLIDTPLYCRPNSFFYQDRSIWRCMARNTRFGRVDCSQASNFRSSGTLHGGRTILPSQHRLLDPWAVILRAPTRSFSFALLLARHIVPPTAILPVLVSASVQALPSSHPARHLGKIPMIPSPKRVELLPCASYDDPRKPR